MELNKKELQVIYNALERYKIHAMQMAIKERGYVVPNFFWKNRVIEISELIEKIEKK